jgi:hypothetical protein
MGMVTSALIFGFGILTGFTSYPLLRKLYRSAKHYGTAEAANARKLRALHARKLRALHNIHRGRRAVIIGNGPSLKISDLDKLRDEITFASNKIYLAFDHTAWRPTYLSCSDILVAKNNRESLNNLGMTKIFGDSVKAEFADRDDIMWLHEDGWPPQRFSKDCSKVVYGGYSVVYYQLQLAFYMGVREVCLIGMDFSFNMPRPSGETCDHGEIIVSEGEVNHFHKDYRKPGETWTMPRLDKQLEAFICAKKTFESAGRRVYNASRATKLDVFDRVDFDAVF